MPFALVFIGLILIVTGFQNTYRQFGQKVQGDFTGPNNFIYWMISVLIVGSVGYVKGLEGFSRAFMTLIVLALVLNVYKQNPGIFTSIATGIGTGSTTPVDPIGAPLVGSGGGAGINSNTGGSFDLSNIGEDVSIASTVADFL